MANDFGKPRAMVFYGRGENCHDETVFAYNQVGANPEKVLYKSFLRKPGIMRDFQILDFPGGFMDGDDLGSAKAMAFSFRNNDYVMEEVERHIKKGGLIKGTCNGFQLLVKAGILPGLDGNYRDNSVTLTYNDSGRFEDRWVRLEIDGSGKSPWTEGMRSAEFPVRHGEGKLVPKDDEVLRRLREEGLIIGRYAGKNGEKNPGYPRNPNGSVDDIAMLSDPTGRVLGLMPHPEAYLKRTNHPRWTRESLPAEGEGLQFFRNGVEYVKRNL
ncbi:MAG: phosphoribosylformylglycinamidine synthase subunit PurQ [Candidatus Aenigmarchaeota archaeon]|nr:phosphoribosylformylglycinamidine synthase subunit PurQ [Candidatus Aenigmarchaeota archaeon]